MARVRVPFAPPPTHLDLGVQSMGRANRRDSARFARFAAQINRVETAQETFSGLIRPVVSVGGFRVQYFGSEMVYVGRVGQAGKRRRLRWRCHSRGNSPMRMRRRGVSSTG